MVDSVTASGVTPQDFQGIQDIEDPEKTLNLSQLLTLVTQELTTQEGNDTVSEKPEIPPPSTDALDVANLLASIKSKINEAMTGIAKENIDKNRADQLQKFQERIKQLQEAIEALKKAEKWGVLGKIFGWVVPAVMVAVGAALVATGLAAPLGAALIAGGIVGLAAQTLEATGGAQWIQEKLLTPMFEALGLDKEKAQLAATITYQVIIIIIMIAASLGAGAAASGMAAGAAAASSAASAGTSAAATAASQSAQTAAKVAVSLTQALLGLAQAGLGLAQAMNQKDAADHEATATEINALLKKLQQKLEEQEDQLKELIESWQRGMDVVMNVIETQSAMANTAMQV